MNGLTGQQVNMKKLTIFTILTVTAIALAASPAFASPDKATFISGIVYRDDGKGDYTFDEATTCIGNTIELASPYQTGGEIYEVTANWEFRGQVTMEVSTTGKTSDYVSITNGVPLEFEDFTSGSKLLWRATLAPGSTLIEVKITYKDSSGIVGTFGTPELSGFMFRKPIYITHNSQLTSHKFDLFHYQVPIEVGESSKAADCDFCLKGVIQADFSDVRFTQADQETLLPYYLEKVTGNSPGRTATFWVKIPQIPPEGLKIYLYYGNADAEDLSDPKSVFDLFDDFNAPALDEEKWTLGLDADFSLYELSSSLLRLDAAKITSNDYTFGDGIIEYRAKTTNGAIAAIIRGAAQEAENRLAYSSNLADVEHCIAIGSNVKINQAKPISIDTFYNYRITADGKTLAFQRYNADFAELDAEVEYEDTDGPAAGYLGLSAASQGLWVYYDWVRVRKFAESEPAIDIARTKTAQEEVPNIPEFNGITIASNGDLVLNEEATSGEYISPLIHSPFHVRIIVPRWTMDERRRMKDEGTVAIDVSAKEYSTYKEGCASGVYYYASKGHFDAGDKLRWRARFSHDMHDETSYFKEFTMDFRPGRIELIRPNGGERVVVGEEYSIVWSAPDFEPSYEMDLTYSKDGGRTYKEIASLVSNSGRYVWVVPDTISDTAVLKVSDSLDGNIYGVSDDYFSIVPAGEISSLRGDEATEAISEELEVAKEVEEETPAAGLYDLLIKIGDNPNEGGYREGDIVMIKPAGFGWTDKERRNFLVVQTYLTEEEVIELVMPQGRMRRKHKIDLDKQGLEDEKIQAMRGLLRSKPLIGIEKIEEKE